MIAKLGLSALLLLAAGVASPTGHAERWLAYSRTAESITGSIVLSAKGLHMNRVDFPLELAAKLERFETAVGPTAAEVYTVTAPKNPVLLNGTRLCRAPVRWAVFWKTDKGLLGMAAFDSKSMPLSVKSSGYCGSYYYSRPNSGA